MTGVNDHPFERPALVRALRLARLPAPTWPLARLVAGGYHPETPRAVAADFARANPLPRRRSAYTVPAACCRPCDVRSRSLALYGCTGLCLSDGF
jgi:hypothetical protein